MNIGLIEIRGKRETHTLSLSFKNRYTSGNFSDWQVFLSGHSLNQKAVAWQRGAAR